MPDARTVPALIGIGLHIQPPVEPNHAANYDVPHVPSEGEWSNPQHPLDMIRTEDNAALRITDNAFWNAPSLHRTAQRPAPGRANTKARRNQHPGRIAVSIFGGAGAAAASGAAEQAPLSRRRGSSQPHLAREGRPPANQGKAEAGGLLHILLIWAIAYIAILSSPGSGRGVTTFVELF